jgi:centromere/kinetochore protein ZW10
MSLEDVVIGLKAYKEVDQRMDRLWQDINKAILLPRMDMTMDTLPALHAQDVSILHPPQTALSNARHRGF